MHWCNLVGTKNKGGAFNCIEGQDSSNIRQHFVSVSMNTSQHFCCCGYNATIPLAWTTYVAWIFKYEKGTYSSTCNCTLASCIGNFPSQCGNYILELVTLHRSANGLMYTEWQLPFYGLIVSMKCSVTSNCGTSWRSGFHWQIMNCVIVWSWVRTS